MFVHNKKVYEHIESNLFNYDKEIVTETPRAPIAEWKKGKLTLLQWREILSFFRKNSEDEVQVRLYYNDILDKWKAHALPQSGIGLSTTEQNSTPEFKAQRAEILREGYMFFGSVHHHCDSSAFQSGTDLKDELSTDGFHATVGFVNKEYVDLDFRFTFKKTVYISNPFEFIEVGDTSNKLKEDIANLKLSFNRYKTKYPEIWDKNVIVKVRPRYQYINRPLRDRFLNVLDEIDMVIPVGEPLEFNSFVQDIIQNYIVNQDVNEMLITEWNLMMLEKEKNKLEEKYGKINF